MYLGKADKDTINYGSYQCLETKRAKIETDLRAAFRSRHNLQDNLCNVLRLVITMVEYQSGALSLVEILEILCSHWLDFNMLVPRSMP